MFLWQLFTGDTCGLRSGADISLSTLPNSLCFYGNCFQMIPEGEGQEQSVSWARYQMAVTKYKEDEKRSSSMYAIWDGAKPVVDFQSFIDDNEAIDDVVSTFFRF